MDSYGIAKRQSATDQLIARTDGRTNGDTSKTEIAPHVSYPAKAVDNRDCYVESWADHAFTAFLAHLTPGKVLKDRQSGFSKTERKRASFMVERGKVERAQFQDWQLRVADEWAERNTA